MLAIFTIFGAGPARAQSLDDELRGLLASHPQIRSKTKSISGADEGVGVARAGYLPTVKLSGESGPEWIDSPDRRNAGEDPYFRNHSTGTLTVTQHLFDGFATPAAVDAAKVTKEIAEADLRATRQTILLEAITAYLGVLRSTQQIRLQRENERKVQEQLKLEDERVEKGSGITSDVLNAKQRLQTAKEARVRYEGDLNIAAAKYSQVFGHAPDAAALADPPVPGGILPPSMDEALSTAERENPQIETANHNIALAQERRRTAEAGYYPTVDIVGKGDDEKGKNGVAGLRRDWSVLLTINFELFSGFKTMSQVAQATYEHGASQDNRLHQGRKVQEAVRTAWYKLSTARERLGLLENAAVLAEELFNAIQKQHLAGKISIQEVLDSETKINDARINFNNAYYDMLTSSYELLAALGRLELDIISAHLQRAPEGNPDLDAIERTVPIGGSPQEPPAPGRVPRPPVAR